MLAHRSFELCAAAAEWLLFHHLIDISSLLYSSFCPSKLLLPTALLKTNYAMDVYHFPLMKLSMCQGSFWIQRCYIHIVDGSSIFSLGAVPICWVVFELLCSLCCNLSCLLALFAAIGPTYREWWQCLSHLLSWGKYEETSLSLSKCKRWFAKVKSELWKITYTDNTSACRIIMADYCMAATIRIMIPITVNTMMKIILKSCQSIMKEEGECKAKKRQSAVY